MFVSLKPLAERGLSADQVIARLRPKLGAGRRAPGCSCKPVQDIRVGGRQSNAQYQYTLQSDDLHELYEWVPKITAALQQLPRARPTSIPTSSRRGWRPTLVDRPRHRGAARHHRQRRSTTRSTTRSASARSRRSTRAQPVSCRDGGGAASTGRTRRRSTRSISAPPAARSAAPSRPMRCAGTVTGKAAPASRSQRGRDGRPDRRRPARNQATNAIANTGRSGTSTGAAVSTAHETMVPLSAFAQFGPGNTPLAVNHQGLFVATHDLVQSHAGRVAERGDRGDRRRRWRGSAVPATIHGSFQGTAQAFQQSLRQRAVPDRWRRCSPSTSCSASSTRATSTR